MNTPVGWDEAAHTLWTNAEQKQAINQVLTTINQHGKTKPVTLWLQFAYYLFLLNDNASAAQALHHANQQHPNNKDVLVNLAVCLSKSGRYKESILYSHKALSIDPKNITALDSLTSCLAKTGEYRSASITGARAIEIKTQNSLQLKSAWVLPSMSPSAYCDSTNKKSVISFSLWGQNPRYLRGALDNTLALKKIYPNWQIRFYVDETVPTDLTNALNELGAELCVEAYQSSLKNKLSWRFKVANDPEVSRFLVRDVDSLINLREHEAVQSWIDSDRWFHIMRDWWTHTDPILAGMWGGVAGVLPSIETMINDYSPSTLETPNIDQQFLREHLWRYVSHSCLIHDRCFKNQDSQSWPSPAEDKHHVGQDVFSAHRIQQEVRLSPWTDRLKSLQIT